MILFTSTVFLLLCLSVNGRPENLVAKAFLNEDQVHFYKALPAHDRQEYDAIAEEFRNLIGAGIEVQFKDFVNMARFKYPDLYEKLAQRQKEMEDKENALPESVKKFIKDRREEVKSWFANGVLDEKAFARSASLTGSQIAAMDEPDRAALFDYYPHMQELLENPHFKAFMTKPDGLNDELLAVLE
ncbi:hypothetical protein QR680_015539 [Steinernema hermaphroditum]|uniref:Fatty-acid and retinol-binding protein 1 n=1 Tax=Steinernema hermaphroditum TaxID=289476 RepID=A0AA39LKX3_9BILA|nr:hypothetical protein QR680_015539 [Steinernema hermaphroditum]